MARVWQRLVSLLRAAPEPERPAPRLPHAAPELAARLGAASAADQRAVARAVSDATARVRPVDDERYAAARAQLSAGRYGGTRQRAALRELVDALELRQWDLQDAYATGAVNEADYVVAFQTARAAAALWAALDRDAEWAVLEASQEALEALNQDVRRVEDVVDTVLGT